MTCFVIEYTNEDNITRLLNVEFINNRCGESFVNFYCPKDPTKVTKFDSVTTAHRVIEVLANFGPNYIPKDTNKFYKKFRIVELNNDQANFDRNDRNLVGCEQYCEKLYRDWKARIEWLNNEIARLEALENNP